MKISEVKAVKIVQLNLQQKWLKFNTLEKKTEFNTVEKVRV